MEDRAVWTPIGKALYDPVAVSPEPGKTVLLARHVSGDMMYTINDGESWQPWQSLGHPKVKEGPALLNLPVDWPLAACSSGPGQIDLVARSPDGELLHARGALPTLATFTCLGAPALSQGNRSVPMGIVGPPAVCSRQRNHIDILAVGLKGDLLHTRFDGESWHPFQSLGMPSIQVNGTSQAVPMTGPITACAIDENHFGVFFRGAFGDLMLKWWDGTAWSAYTSLGSPQVENEMYPAITFPSPLAGAPTACSWGPGRLDIVVRGSKGDMVHTWWNGEEWHDFESLWMPISSEPDPACLPFTGAATVCSPSSGLLHVFGRALDGNIFHLEYHALGSE